MRRGHEAAWILGSAGSLEGAFRGESSISRHSGRCLRKRSPIRKPDDRKGRCRAQFRREVGNHLRRELLGLDHVGTRYSPSFKLALLRVSGCLRLRPPAGDPAECPGRSFASVENDYLLAYSGLSGAGKDRLEPAPPGPKPVARRSAGRCRCSGETIRRLLGRRQGLPVPRARTIWPIAGRCLSLRCGSGPRAP
ncbi:hypothetical protein DF3PB_1440004 [uncultured Defluviicoccus sp.]|uniref:Uncharacterized protein n=1 Tax=metagenome TaxID=256318 RepID=A0A380TBC1_9ZZZZ|nr:hypothetical protein DF3PB_1440004 [uncultured Defluviicoccus sp.]